MFLSGIAKFLIGFILGIAILAGSGAAVAYYLFTKLAANPPKPIFAEEQKRPLPAKTASSPKASKSPAVKPASPSASPSPTPSESPTPEELPTGAYKARVSWPEGLSLRDEPGLEANRVGGVAYNQEIIILKESEDQKWQKVRIVDGDQEGWIKAGNTERLEDSEESSAPSPQQSQ
ncbi:MAG TPA: peptide-binding protein [Cyanobacteria bacterium UBA8803]|nr:peptide-binding protein [Cyanobacteria bacterium UBA9273]HBL60388.1 peptide-binding protein [Cyanobacteria bacterium UBA8803]